METARSAPAVRSRHPGQDASRRPLLRVLGGGGPCTVVLVAIVLAVLAAQFPFSTGGSAAAGPPADARIAFLSDAQENRDFLGFTLTTYDGLMLDPRVGDVSWQTALAVVLAGWVVVEKDLAAATAPARYREIRGRYLLAVEPLATTAREMTGADEWFHGKPDVIAMDGLDLLTLAFAVGRARPLVRDADRLLDAALAGAGPDRVTTSQPCYACMLGGADRRTLYLLTNPPFGSEDFAAGGGRVEAVAVDVPGVGWP